MVPKRNETVVILGITIEENAKHIFPKKSFIPKQWVNFQGLEELQAVLETYSRLKSHVNTRIGHLKVKLNFFFSESIKLNL